MSSLNATNPVTLLADISMERMLWTESDKVQSAISSLVDRILEWQNSPGYMRYLKEWIRTKSEIYDHFSEELSTTKAVLFLLRERAIPEIEGELVGYLLYHFYNEDRDSLELSFRVSPYKQKSGKCTKATKETSEILLDSGHVKEIVAYHAAENNGSLKVFHRAGFTIGDYQENAAYLSYADEQVDVFQWEKRQSQPTTLSIRGNNNILEALGKHKVITRLQTSDLRIIPQTA